VTTLAKPIWTYRLEKERRVTVRCPAAVGDIAYIVFFYDRDDGSESKLLAIDINSGSPIWEHKIASVGNEAIVDHDGRVYWSSFSGDVYAFLPGGAQLWKNPGAKSSIGVPYLSSDRHIVVGEISGRSKETWCLDRGTGEVLWHFEHGGHSYAIVSNGDYVFHASARANGFDKPARCGLYCLNLLDGTLKWSVIGTEYLFGPIVIGESLIVGSNRSLRAFDVASGAVLAELTLTKENSSHQVSTCSTQDSIIVKRDGHGQGGDTLTAVRLDSSTLTGHSGMKFLIQWMIDEPRGLCGSPIALPDDKLSYLTHDGTICILERASGLLLGETRLKTKACW
jgi:outer membrane protein assembly factor BamB